MDEASSAEGSPAADAEDVNDQDRILISCRHCGRYVRKGRMTWHIERECPNVVRCATIKEGDDG